MPWVREKKNWIPLYIIIGVWIFYKYQWRSWFVFMIILVAIAASDQTASGLFKPLVHRLRPCAASGVAEHLRLIIPCGGGFSFFSSHAANHSALSFLLIYYLKPRKIISATLILWAVSICFAQVYVGYHYPSDVLCGAICGIVVSCILTRLSANYFQKLHTA
jgi:undecaprenyl-diphosphatase